jgi:hypothetical protein
MALSDTKIIFKNYSVNDLFFLFFKLSIHNKNKSLIRVAPIKLYELDLAISSFL